MKKIILFLILVVCLGSCAESPYIYYEPYPRYYYIGRPYTYPYYVPLARYHYYHYSHYGYRR